MKCEFCGKDFEPKETTQLICDNCKYSLEEEFTNGKGDDENE